MKIKKLKLLIIKIKYYNFLIDKIQISIPSIISFSNFLLKFLNLNNLNFHTLSSQIHLFKSILSIKYNIKVGFKNRWIRITARNYVTADVLGSK